MTTALVIGGSGGIGRAIVGRLADEGMSVLVGYRSRVERAEQVVGDLPGSGHRAVAVDVTSPDSLAALTSQLSADPGVLDVLVNGAGITEPVAHDDLDGLHDDLIDKIFRVNWRGAFASVRALRPLLDRSPQGVVVNLSSVAGTTGSGSNVAYCASKAALDSMTRSLGRALAPSIRMVSVAPGWVRGEYAERMPADLLETQRTATPLGRLATPDDVAATVVAAVRHMPMTTGAVLPVDGGRPLGTA